MNPWISNRDQVVEAATNLFQSKVDEVVSNAENNPEDALNLTSDEESEIIDTVSEQTDDLEQSVIDSAGVDADSGVSEETIDTAKVVTAFFVLAVVKRAIERTHGAVIARQTDSELNPEPITHDEAVDNAVEVGLREIQFVGTSEVGTSYGEMVKEHHESLGDTSYIWNTTFNNSRQTHIDNHSQEFNWDDPPATGHPGHEPNCQCWVSRPNEDQVENKIEVDSMKNFKSMVDGDILKIDIHGVIVQDAWYDDEVGSIQVINAINSFDGDYIELSIYSGGGDAFAGSAIKSILQQHSAKVTANIYGLAASAATTIAGGADNITMGDTDSFLIHNAWTIDLGDKNQLRKTAQDLETLDKSIAFGWSKRSGKSQEEIHSLMDEDRFMTAQESLDFGLIDEIRETGTNNCVGGFCAPKASIELMPKEIVNKYNIKPVNGRIGQKELARVKQESKLNKSEINQTEDAKVSLDEAKAKISILENEKGDLLNKIESLEGSQAGDELRENIRNEVREELKTERAEMNSVIEVLNEVDIEAQGESVTELKRNALINQKVKGADELSDDSVGAVFDYLIENKKSEKSKEEAGETGAALAGSKNSQDKGQKTSFKMRGAK